MNKWWVSIWNKVGFSPCDSIYTSVLCGRSFSGVPALVKHRTVEMLYMRKHAHTEDSAHIFDALFLGDISISWSDPSSLKIDLNSWGYDLLEQDASTRRDCTFKGCLRAMGLSASFYPSEMFMSFLFSLPWVPKKVSLVVRDEMRHRRPSFKSWLCCVLNSFL